MVMRTRRASRISVVWFVASLRRPSNARPGNKDQSCVNGPVDVSHGT